MSFHPLTVLLRTSAGAWAAILGISAVIIVLAVVVGVKQRNKLMGEGKIVNRPHNFYDMAEIFTLGPVTLQAISNALASSDFSGMGVQMQPDPQNQQIIFRQNTWTGLLKYMGMTGDPSMGGKTVYRLWITSYRTYRSSVQGALEMNMLMTEIEKVLLCFDPGTQVSTEMVIRKTKTKFF